MSVSNGEFANEDTFNDAFPSRTDDTDVSGLFEFLGNVAFRETTNAAITGATATLPHPGTVALRVTNASLLGVAGISTPSRGKLLLLINDTGDKLPILNDNAGATTGNKIYTGTQDDLDLPNQSMGMFYYDDVTDHWRLMGGAGSGSGSGISEWVTGTEYETDAVNPAVVMESNKIYKCLVTHTAGTFATDLAANYWVLVSNPAADIAAAIAALVDSAPSTLDTLNELAAALGDDPNFAATMATALGLRLRVDTAAQGLTGTQKTNAKTNLDLQNVPNVDTTTTANITDSSNKRFVTDLNLAKLSNLNNWTSVSRLTWIKNNNAPITNLDLGFQVEEFYDGDDQQLFALVKVPSNYVAGSQIKLAGGKVYTATASGAIRFNITTTLINSTSVMTSLTNQYSSTLGTINASATPNTINSLADYDLTNASGQINGVAVAAGDLLALQLYRSSGQENPTRAAVAKLIIESFELKFA